MKNFIKYISIIWRVIIQIIVQIRIRYGSKMKTSLSTDEMNEAIRALEFVESNILKVIFDSYYWKWIIIAIHNSMQNFMVCGVPSSSKLNILNKRSAKKMQQYYNGETDEYPEEKLEYFINLYNRIKSDVMLIYEHSKKFVSNEKQDDNITKLHHFRNNFIHFVPKGLLIDVREFPDYVDTSVEVIKFLAFESGNIFYPDDGTCEKIRQLVNDVKIKLDTIKAAYEY